MSYENYNRCVDQTLKNLNYPNEKNSLYEQKLYDNQIARQKCYQKYPHKIIEGFNANTINFRSIIACLVLILFIYLLAQIVVGFTTDTVNLGVESVEPYVSY